VAVEETALDDLLSTVPEEDRPQFDKLAAAVKQQLSGVKVYRVGDEPEKQVYVVGKASDGKWAGLKTTVVEA
jgi:histidine triad (HIT) family protein